MNKKQYIAPEVEVLEMKNLSSILAHFSADASFIGDYEETDPEEVDMLGPGY